MSCMITRYHKARGKIGIFIAILITQQLKRVVMPLNIAEITKTNSKLTNRNLKPTVNIYKNFSCTYLIFISMHSTIYMRKNFRSIMNLHIAKATLETCN